MSTFQVTGVRTERSPTGYHDHISHVRIGAATILTRGTVVNDLRIPGGDRYYTEVNGRKANVEVVHCPNCTFADYIRTDADASTANNLLSLPKI